MIPQTDRLGRERRERLGYHFGQAVHFDWVPLPHLRHLDHLY